MDKPSSLLCHVNGRKLATTHQRLTVTLIQNVSTTQSKKSFDRQLQALIRLASCFRQGSVTFTVEKIVALSLFCCYRSVDVRVTRRCRLVQKGAAKPFGGKQAIECFFGKLKRSAECLAFLPHLR
jgi:hypothetical protein